MPCTGLVALLVTLNDLVPFFNVLNDVYLVWRDDVEVALLVEVGVGG